MKKYKYTKTWVGPDGKRKVVRSDDEEQMWAKYFKARYGSEFGSESMVLVDTWFHKAVDIYKTNMKPETKYGYIKCCEKHVLPHIGKKFLGDVSAADCQNVLNGVAGKSNQLIAQVQQILNFIFTTAIYQHYIGSNPAQYLQKPKGKEKATHRALYQDERAALKKLFDGPSQERLRIFEIMYYCGCRPSEIWRMTKNDIYEKNDVALLYIRAGKSKAAERYVPVPADLTDKLKHGGHYLVTTEQGNPLDKTKYRRIALRLYREMDIAMGATVYRNQIIESKLYPDFVPYCIRHDYCSRLKNANVDIRTAQYLMGHSDIAMTANIYTHTTDADIGRVGQDIINGISGIPNPWANQQPIKLY